MMNTKKSTHQNIMDTAQKLIQRKGFNAFSYADIAKELDIKTSSIHYYFPSKTDLGLELMKRYRKTIQEVLEQVDQSELGSREKLQEYLQAYQSIFSEDGRICLCVMLSSDIITLEDSIQQEVKLFLQLNLDWLAKTLEEGVKCNAFNCHADTHAEASLFLSTLIGSMLLARANPKSLSFHQIGQVLYDKYTLHD
ncbi:TetR/AcrR family transcriptional regulator [Cohnella terricola]|uniref:TetR/AcrR family transcriptional regulator n=1 Tax=Cohnella terricola TaxID=1289167 RepID=A0A559JWI7_9BACL|nr:TetR/AcrR family transcriptional regulator [Cohnella terricola]TVY04170.1 TetR/AcrR family transcriptional regulator [Cohnella terricola]